MIQCKNCRHQNQDNTLYCTRCSIPLYETEIKKEGKYQLQTKDGKVFSISSTEITIGRKGKIAFPEDGFMSRNHAKIINVAGSLTLQDLNSQNGTFINGEKIHQSQKIKTGDKIKCGNTTFTVQNV